MTVVICIGNSDNKLSQQNWSDFVSCIDKVVIIYSNVVHFSGGPATDKPYQNYAWIIDIDDNASYMLKDLLERYRKRFGQESIVWMVGNSEFI